MRRIVFVRCEDCGGRGYIPVRVVPFSNAWGACAGGGAVACSCAGGYRAVVVRR